MKHKKKKSRFSMKWSLIWIVIHSVSLFLLGVILKYLDLQNSFVQLLLMGFGVTIFARIVKIFTAKKRFVVDKWFVFWSVINSVTIWIFFMLMNAINVNNYLITSLLTAMGLVLVAYFVRRFRITKTILWISVVIILLLLFFTQTSNQQNMIYSSSQNIEVSTGNIFESLKNMLPATISKECPQMNVPLRKVQSLLPFMDVKEYEGWKIAPYDTNTMLGFNFGQIYCHKGSKQGQNPNYWYCGDQSSQTTMAFMQKTIINSDGSIGKTIKQSFYNVYDENQQFVKTVCGDNPDKIAEREWEEFKQQAEDFWS